MINTEKIGLGGGCHWCTEAVFKSIEGVITVEQGYISSVKPNADFSEAVVVHFDNAIVNLRHLLKIHLLTHSSTAKHSFRSKYRSAVYYYSEIEKSEIEVLLSDLQKEFDEELITQVLKFQDFKPSRESLQDYFGKNPDAPFCTRYIIPKLTKISTI